MAKHAGDPKEEDVMSRDQYGIWVEFGKLCVLSGHPRVENGQSAEENQVSEHIAVLAPLFRVVIDFIWKAFAVMADHSIGIFAVVPDRNAMPPPKLAADAPVAQMVDPMKISALPMGWD